MKLHTAFLATAIVLSLAACKPNEEKKPESTNVPEAMQQTESQTSTMAPSGDTQTTSPSASQGVTTPPVTGSQSESTTTTGSTAAGAGAMGAGAAATQSDSAAAANTGTTECDELLTAVTQCIKEKVPEDQRNSKLKQINDMASQWKNLPEATRAAACKSARDSVKESYANLGCTL